MKRMTCSGIGIALVAGLLALPAGAQNQASSNSQSSGSSQSSASDSSLGDYARQIRKSPAPAKPKVFDNDNLPRNDKLSVVGTPAEGTAAAGEAQAQTETKTTGEEKTSAAGAANAPEQEDGAKQAMWKQWGDKIAAQKEQIDLLARELDVLQREYKVRAAAMYGDVGSRLRNSGDWDKQDAQYKQQIADKQKALDDAKQKLDDMVEDARKAGVPASIREP
jgi:hypothetical protein